MSDKKRRPTISLVARDASAPKGQQYITLLVAWEGEKGPMWSIDSRLTDEQMLEILADQRKPFTERRFKLYQNTYKGAADAQDTTGPSDWV